jgi:hypothetical protein
MVAPPPGFATGLKLMLSKRFSMSNRTSTLVRFVIGNRFVTPTSIRPKNGARIKSVRGAQSPARNVMQSAPVAGAK